MNSAGAPLARRPGRVFTRYQIVDAIHGSDYLVTERAVDVQIVSLRKKLGGCAKYVDTVRGVGYVLEERESGRLFDVVREQIAVGLEGLSKEQMAKVVIAYEPVWAIGTGKTATRDQAQEAHQYIRSLVKTDFGDALSSAVRILYGGSVKPENVTELMQMPDIDGALVGGASLDAESFSRIVKFK